jgi:hypothetical protein
MGFLCTEREREREREKRLLIVLCKLQQKRLPEEAVGGILEMCMLVDTAAEIQELVETATDCSFLYWCRGMMPTCFSLLYSQTNEAHSLQYLVMAFQDGIKLLELGHAENDVINSYEEEMENAISNVRFILVCTSLFASQN